MVPEAEHRKFISQAVCTIFQEIFNVWSHRQNLKAPGQVWDCLKAFQLQQETLLVGFNKHSFDNNVLTEQLKTSIVTKMVMEGKLNKLQEEVLVAHKEAQDALKLAQQAM